MQKVVDRIEGFIPEAIGQIESIVNDKSVDAKTRIRASSLLLRYRDELKRIIKIKQKGGEVLSQKENLSRG